MTCREWAALPAIAPKATPAPLEKRLHRVPLPPHLADSPVSILGLLRSGTTAESQAFPFRNTRERLPIHGLERCNGSARLRSEQSCARDRSLFCPHSIIQCAESFLRPAFASARRRILRSALWHQLYAIDTNRRGRGAAVGGFHRLLA